MERAISVCLMSTSRITLPVVAISIGAVGVDGNWLRSHTIHVAVSTTALRKYDLWVR